MSDIDTITARNENVETGSGGYGRLHGKRKTSLLGRLRSRAGAGILVTDISSGPFRYAYLNRNKGRITVLDFGEIDHQQLGVISDDPQDLFRASLVWFEGQTGIKPGDILVVSHNIDFFLRKLDLPLTKRSEIARATRWEIGARIPLEVEDSYLKIRKYDQRDGISSMTVGAVSRIQVNYWQFLGERLIGVVPTAAALVPAGPQAMSNDLTYCYVYFDKSLLCIGFYSSGGLLYYQPIIEESSSNIFENEDRLFGRSRIVDELANCMEVFYNRFPDKRVAGIVLFATPEEISSLAPLISESIVIDVIPADITEGVEIDKSCGSRIPGPEFFPLLGAAKVKKDDFVFIPKTLEDNIKIRMIRRAVYYGLSAGILTILLTFIFLLAGININNYRLKNIINQKTQIENSAAFKTSREFAERTESLELLNGKINIADDLHSEFFKAFGSITPDNIYLNSILLKSGAGSHSVEITGYFDGAVSRGDVAMLDFMDNLKAMGMSEIGLRRLGDKLSGNNKVESFTITGKFSND